MRTKSPAVKARPRFWLRLRNPSLFATSYLNEPNGEDSSDSDVHDKSCDDEGNTGDADPKIVLDSFYERDAPSKKRQCFRTSGTETSSDLPSKDTCIICNRVDCPLLFCSEIGCPIALHEKCFDGELDYDDGGSFYCPYCWYKKQRLRSKALREKAMAAEKALSNFLDEEMVGGGGEKKNATEVERHGKNLSLGRMSNVDQCRDRMDTDELIDQGKPLEQDQLNNGYPSEQDDHHNEKTIDDQRWGAMEENNSNDQEGKCDGITEDQRWEDEEEKTTDQLEVSEDVEAANLEKAEKSKLQGAAEDQQVVMEEEYATNQSKRLEDEEGIQKVDVQCEQMDEDQHEEPHDAVSEDKEKSRDGSVFVSIPETFEMQESKENQENVQRKKQLDPNERASSVSSSASTSNHTQMDQDDLTLSMFLLQRRGKQTMRNKVSSGSSKKSCLLGASPVGNRRNQGEEKTSRTKRKSSVVNNDRRKKLFWTLEEEKILWEGTEKFSAEANKKTPWRKILAFGKDVFHETRTPQDLKDKWRNMTGKKS